MARSSRRLFYGATVGAVLSGNPERLESVARDKALLANGFSATAALLRAIDGGRWTGPAADAFRRAVDIEPGRFSAAAVEFLTASMALYSAADAKREAQRVVAAAIARYDEAYRRSLAWQLRLAEHEQLRQRALFDPAAATELAVADAVPYQDPGAEEREHAQRQVDAAVAVWEIAASSAAAKLRAARQSAPRKPNLLQRGLHYEGQFVAGAAEATWGLVVMAVKFSPTRMMIDPDGWQRDVVGMAKGLWYGVQHPVEFGKAVLDWETWAENPARALGHLVPDLALTIATAGGGAAVKGARGVQSASALRRMTSGADDAARLGRTVTPLGRTYENTSTYLADVASHYGINLRGVKPVMDYTLPVGTQGVTRRAEGGWIIRVNPGFVDEAELANTIAHELRHARDFQKGGPSLEENAYRSGDALEEWIRGLR